VIKREGNNSGVADFSSLTDKFFPTFFSIDILFCSPEWTRKTSKQASSFCTFFYHWLPFFSSFVRTIVVWLNLLSSFGFDRSGGMKWYGRKKRRLFGSARRVGDVGVSARSLDSPSWDSMRGTTTLACLFENIKTTTTTPTDLEISSTTTSLSQDRKKIIWKYLQKKSAKKGWIYQNNSANVDKLKNVGRQMKRIFFCFFSWSVINNRNNNTIVIVTAPSMEIHTEQVAWNVQRTHTGYFLFSRSKTKSLSWWKKTDVHPHLSLNCRSSGLNACGSRVEIFGCPNSVTPKRDQHLSAKGRAHS